MRQEFEPLTSPPQPTGISTSTFEGVETTVPPDSWLAREMARGQAEKRRLRQEKLQRKLRAAESCEQAGRWGSFAVGVLWLLGILSLVLDGIAGGANDLSPVLVIAWVILPVAAFVYLVGWLRRALVLFKARRHGIDLQIHRPIIRRWIVVEEPAAVEQTLSVPPPPMDGSSAGAQLAASLAADRQYRFQRERLMQRKLDVACRFEQWGRRACLGAAFCSIFFFATLVTGDGTGSPRDAAQVLMIAAGLPGVVGLTLGTLSVLLAKLRQRWMLKHARVQALEVTRVNDSPGSS